MEFHSSLSGFALRLSCRTYSLNYCIRLKFQLNEKYSKFTKNTLSEEQWNNVDAFLSVFEALVVTLHKQCMNIHRTVHSEEIKDKKGKYMEKQRRQER